jgi:hypothetical protein
MEVFSMTSGTRVFSRRRSIPLIPPTNSRYFSTVISEYRGGFSGRYPILRRTSIDCSKTSNPAMEALPLVAGMKQVSIRMVVVLPAAFGPRKPRISPRPTVNETSCTAVLDP